MYSKLPQPGKTGFVSVRRLSTFDPDSPCCPVCPPDDPPVPPSPPRPVLALGSRLVPPSSVALAVRVLVHACRCVCRGSGVRVPVES
ncbi:uncharacterized protein PHACADRAFT_248110 [Phanerochaete carnosa HHB-10118-sp]|uniref:Uncharacterized protein n=1 Tax=Phanerochaete carnosa (strain HHB-10118-sp) TaxID=650164 RepID=K5WQF9_PHACS|nr:uncharacterized protein PHACADRAFT_248110 [Phanerochaete carnosa HHB-10118-sp]EKM61474.1 hypothetical protein PHACADRAFT_248110 [Phanerochaete carnosa HHB-10118-sp]